MDITMSRVRLASDTCDIYFTYTKVNHLLYTCSLDPFEDGILLDIPLVCMHRYCRNFTDDEEECKRQGTPTPSAREAWKRRQKKRSFYDLQPLDDRTTGSHRTSDPLQPSDDRRTPNIRQVPGTGRPTLTGNPVPPIPKQNGGRPTPTGRPAPPVPRRISGRPTHTTGRLVPACVHPRAFGLVPLSHLPLRG